MSIAIEQLPGAHILTGPQSWQVLQRVADGRAPVTLEGVWAGETAGTVEVRVACEENNAPAAGCDWQDAEMLEGNRWRITLRVPTGGLYSIETRVRMLDIEWRNTGDKIWHVSVGDLWVIAGQSNAVGYGHGMVSDPPVPGISVFGGNEVWRLATHPIFDPTGTKHPANRDSGWIDVSPWLAFAREILRDTGVPIGLIPAALGGSPLSAWDPGNLDGAYLYDNMVEMITAADGRVAGMLWYQGESDANEELSATYLMRFTRFIEALRARYGADLPVITVQLNRYVDGEFSEWSAEKAWSMIREIQRQAAKQIPRLAVVPALDAGLSDGIHNSAEGCVLIGQRCGWAALGMVYGKDIAWQAVDVDTVQFTDDTRTVVKITFAPVVNHIKFLKLIPPDFLVEDAEGRTPIKAARIEGNDAVVLELDRAVVGNAVCHHAFGYDPVTTLRDHLNRPMLAYYGVSIEEA